LIDAVDVGAHADAAGAKDKVRIAATAAASMLRI
jgi:hypothetical protein